MRERKMMRRCAWVVGAMLLLLLLIFKISYPVSAATSSTKYAYSIGVNHGLFGTYTGDFTSNVDYAATCYGMISNVTSYKSHTPTYTYMRGNNPDGTRRIASDIVFLNGHANYDNIIFNYKNKSGEYATGVYIGTDWTSSTSGYVYAGLGSTDMSTCDLISLVGCKTAANDDYNITWKAYNQGANSAVGFTSNIHSRSTAGKGWLKKYNDALANGYTVSKAITYATSYYSTSDLATYVKIYGSSSNKVASTSTSEVSELVDIDTAIEFSDIQSDVFANYGFSLGYSSELVDELLNAVQTIDTDFNPDDYNITVNMFAPQDGNGMIIMNYVMDGCIETDKAYIATIENNEIVNVTANNVASKLLQGDLAISVDEDQLTSMVLDHLNSCNTAEVEASMENVVDVTEKYYYYYESGELIYEGSVFYEDAEADNAIFDVTTETVLN